MQYNVEESNIAVTVTAVNFDVAVTASAPLDVVVGESARIDVGAAVNYIKSGQAEIEQAVASGTAAFNMNASQKTDDFNANASSKTSDFNSNATDKTNTFNQNATDKTTAFNTNATNKTDAFDLNASSKTSDFNDNATNKTNAFNQNASDKTTDFNDNYTVKKGLIDAEVSTASGYAADAKQWAIGDPSEPSGNSAKYWADEAAATVSSKANVDLSNLSATGEAKFVKSVTTGSTNGTISVDGTDVAVYGLGSAAYTASTAYDVSGAASTAETNAKNYADGLASNYATAAQGALADTALQPNDNVSELVNDAGYITGITSSDVTTALGYTPYNSSNPSGYITGVAWGDVTGTLSNQTDLYNELYYKAGDTFSGGTGQVDGCIVTNGCLTTSRKSIYFSLVMPKRLNNISTITITSMKAGIRGADGGYIVPLNTDLSTVGTVSAFKACDNIISFWLSLTTESTQTNNIPVSVMIYSMSLSFS